MREPQLRHYNVMIVDDDSDTRDCVSEAIMLYGLSVTTAESGVDALRALHEGVRPQLILVDAHMPRMGGPVFLSTLMASPSLRSFPVILMTGDSSPIPHEAVAVLRKPFSIEQLVAAIDPFVRRSP